MPCQGEREFLGGDAGAVVAHADQADPAVLDVDRHLARSGVERVLDQFLDDGRRALDDLARSDLVDERAFEDTDGHGAACHGVAQSSEKHGAAVTEVGAKVRPPQVPATGISRMVPEATVSVWRWFLGAILDADRVTAGDVTEGLARRNDVAQRLAAFAGRQHGHSRARRRVVVEVAAHARVYRLRQPVLVRRVAELASLRPGWR